MKDNFLTDITVSVYVDDIKIICKDLSQIQALKNDIALEFKIDDIRLISYYLDIKITRDRENRTITLSQEDYIRKILELLNMNKDHSTATSDISGKYYEANSGSAFIEDSHSYLHLINILMYEMIQTCPDYAFQISHLASFAKNPSSKYFGAIKHLICYLHGMVNYCIIYSSIDEADLFGHSDANFGACRITRQSTEAYVFMLNGDLISWPSKQQSIVTLSTTETEYYALSQAIKEAFWLQKLLADLKLYSFDPSMPIPIFVDSTGAIKTGQNFIENDWIKHFDIHYHFVRDEVSSGRICLSYVRSKDNLVDALIKSLTKPLHDFFIKGLRLKKPAEL